MIDLDWYQAAVGRVWEALHPDDTISDIGNSLAEETGEVNRAIIKRKHGSSRSDDWDRDLRYETVDALFNLLAIAWKEGYSLGDLFVERWPRYGSTAPAEAGGPHPQFCTPGCPPGCEGMTPEDAHAFYAVPANREPQGPPVRRVNVRPFSELADGLRRRLADRDTERQRIWEAIQSWTEIAHRLSDDGEPVAVEGTEFKPLAPFFDELHVMVFPDEYFTDDEVSAQLNEVGKRWHEGRDDDEAGSAPIPEDGSGG